MNAPCFEPATEKYVSLATYRRNGIEVKTPVWIAELAGRYYVFSAGDAGKIRGFARRLESDSQHATSVAKCGALGSKPGRE